MAQKIVEIKIFNTALFQKIFKKINKITKYCSIVFDPNNQYLKFTSNDEQENFAINLHLEKDKQFEYIILPSEFTKFRININEFYDILNLIRNNAIILYILQNDPYVLYLRPFDEFNDKTYHLLLIARDSIKIIPKEVFKTIRLSTVYFNSECFEIGSKYPYIKIETNGISFNISGISHQEYIKKNKSSQKKSIFEQINEENQALNLSNNKLSSVTSYYESKSLIKLLKLFQTSETIIIGLKDNSPIVFSIISDYKIAGALKYADNYELNIPSLFDLCSKKLYPVLCPQEINSKLSSFSSIKLYKNFRPKLPYLDEILLKYMEKISNDED